MVIVVGGDGSMLRAVHQMMPVVRPLMGVNSGRLGFLTFSTASDPAEIAARIQEHAFFELDAPVLRVCTAEVPIPYPRHLEEAALPQVARGGGVRQGVDGVSRGVGPIHRGAIGAEGQTVGDSDVAPHTAQLALCFKLGDEFA